MTGEDWSDSERPSTDPTSFGNEVSAGEDTEGVGAEPDSEELIADSPPSAWRSPARLAIVFGSVTAVALVATAGWLGYDGHRRQLAADQRNLFVEVAKQGAINLTTVSYTEVDKDVKRILDSATGAFHEDFEKRSQPFIEVVKQVRSTSTGAVTDAGLESQNGDQAQVLVAVAVETALAGAPEQPPRRWRMRISVQKNGADAKVSNVEFVP